MKYLLNLSRLQNVTEGHRRSQKVTKGHRFYSYLPPFLQLSDFLPPPDRDGTEMNLHMCSSLMANQQNVQPCQEHGGLDLSPILP